MDRMAALFEWLLDGAPGASSAPQVVERLALDARAAEIPIDRVAVFVTTLHPSIVGRAFYWRPGVPVRVAELSAQAQKSDAVRLSPVGEVWRTGVEFRRRLHDLTPADHATLRELAAENYSDFVVLPIVFTTGQVHAISFATQHADGFAEAQLAALRRLLRPLARVTEIFALRRIASNLLDTYVGHSAGERILAGRISRGDIETIRAVVWFSDLRGFTEIAAQQAPRETIDMLNELFECQVPAIEARGGEVLKFIGDGLLAIFPVPELDTDMAAARSVAALDAVDAAFAALAVRNAAAAREIRFGVALHVGEIAYGNIGGASRLDFTAIGAAINLAARLEGLTARVGRSLVVSEDFAAHVPAGRLEELGAFELKGVPGPQRVFGAITADREH
ncbi:adenylate/guanylate cyclase domain-containing protein [Nannocystis sp.]|uniref:adenylate/guanylate cyclase domain-containing protein n=1 Tax=Nannocystis sp. TaxID=1962667 RepID=UPI0025FA63FA|nr:adenylate/guanylate cyclase domain-containing protein [Nannocystis sp.]MBK7829136.1 adenylate/guanylate cyclase domain-containing protein [Nannocystis sp.]